MPLTTPCSSMNCVQILTTWGTAKNNLMLVVLIMGGGDDDDHGHVDDGEDGHVDDEDHGHVDDDDDDVDVEDIPQQNWKCRGSANGASHACLSTLQMHFVQDLDNHDNDDDDDDDNYHLSLAFHER